MYSLSSFDISGATVTDFFPCQLTNVTWTAVDNGGNLIASGSGNINTKIDLPAGGNVTFTATAKVSASATGNICNTASVAAPCGVTDTNPSNNSDTDCDVPAPTGCDTLVRGDAATIGLWNNCNGQALIKPLNGGSTSTTLANWLPASFSYRYGAKAGTNNLTGKTNADIANLFKNFFCITGKKTDAQILAGALAVYVTDKYYNNTSAGQALAAKYGFNLSSTGTGAKTYHVGGFGSSIGLNNYQSYTVSQLLQKVNFLKSQGGYTTTVATAFNNIFSDINQKGDIR